jgi:hypothetical protein
MTDESTMRMVVREELLRFFQEHGLLEQEKSLVERQRDLVKAVDLNKVPIQDVKEALVALKEILALCAKLGNGDAA